MTLMYLFVEGQAGVDPGSGGLDLGGSGSNFNLPLFGGPLNSIKGKRCCVCACEYPISVKMI